MADDKTQLKTYLEFLKQLDTGETNVDRRKSTMSAVTNILQTLLDPDSVEQIKANARKKDSKPALPTYNVRTPIVEMALNGVSIHPSANDGERTHFKDLSITFPLGGVETTVRGTVKLFARDPGLIISLLSDQTYSKDKKSGYPLLTMKWGWAFATSDGVDGIKKVTTPWIDFLVMNVEISNPETTGTEFTFHLQDVGNTVLQYSASNITIDPGYPQEQIRTIVEGCLGLRLFTLDDLLALDNRLVDSTTKESRTFFINDQAGAVRTNGNNFLVLLDRISRNCKCKWYSSVNSKIGESKDGSTFSEKQYDTALRDLEVLKASHASKEKIDEYQQYVDNNLADLAYGCKLYWIDNVPAKWQTTSKSFYIKNNKETGAYFLLPDLSDSQSGRSGNLDLNYGPGGSDFPYLHGSAQNVFNASITNSGQHSQTFGDVLGVNVQYSPFISMLKSSIHEKAMYFVDGEYANSSEKGNIPNVSVSTKPSPSAEEKERIQKEGIAITEDANKRKTSAEAKKVAQDTFRFNNPASIPNYVEIVDSPSTTGLQKQYYNNAPGEVYTEMKLRSRVNHFLKYPVQLTISVLGDPNLIRLNQGGFEVISYYPDATGQYHNLNTLLSGTYFATQVTHTLNGSEYNTTISGKKLSFPQTSGTLITKIIKATEAEDIEARSKSATGTVNNATTTVSDSLNSQALHVDLEDDSFTKSFLSKSLQDLYLKHSGPASK